MKKWYVGDTIKNGGDFMNNQDPFDNHFVISYELLALLEWLMEHEDAALSQIIKSSLTRGLSPNKVAQAMSNENDPDLQHVIVDFLAYLDLLLHEAVNEEEVDQVVQRTLIPAIKHIDKRMYGESTVTSSIAKAQAAAWNHTSYETKTILCKELLRRWKPGKQVMH
jgi:hypothetical protein